ncbi:peptidoglycan-binding protein [Streptomyces phaeochromogenes]|uniref:peptidoglycan-binding domain-containing protein n=1 Tax=Streptomyces phaeochromogenes TaxID=1923 RepID=UPI002E28D33B|nr:peptidoglycan-binding domain-containing protein [Streptomyces phaeochromogenes]
MAAVAPGAGASYPTCNGVKRVTLDAGATTILQPDYTGTGSRNCILQYGNSGSAVEELQFNLIHCHNKSTGGADGIYGDATRQAVKEVQAAAGITADGIYGPETRKAMKWYYYVNGDPGRACIKAGV